MPDDGNYLQQKTAIFRFYGDLNKLLVPNRRGRESMLDFKGRQTVKHLIESLGVPHTEVGLILVDGQAVDFSLIPSQDERVAIFPHFERLTLSQLHQLRPSLDGQPRFALDGHLGRLAAFLRMLGFDALYFNHIDDSTLASLAIRDGRVLLTRDRGLLKRGTVVYGCCLLTLEPRLQLLQVVRRYHLTHYLKPFTRCMVCNGQLHEVRKADVLTQLEPKTRRYFDEFERCADCDKVYWAGSHHTRMLAVIEWLLQQVPPQAEMCTYARGNL